MAQSELIPSLPEEIAMECLIRLHFSAHGVASGVCRRWRHLLRSKDFYYHRKQTGHTRKVACLIQALTAPESAGNKPVGPPRYGVSLFDPVSGSWERVDPVPDYPDGLPLFCQVTSTEGKLVVMGGWDPADYHPVSHVFVYEFTTRKWRKGKNMPEARSFFAASGWNGNVVVAGGHDENKNALKTAWAYDVDSDEWIELPAMSQERDECEGVIIGSEFWVVGGYRTESQGEFEGSAEAIDLSALEDGGGASEWRRVEEVWKTGQCPRSCLGVTIPIPKAGNGGGDLFNWAEVGGGAAKVGACGVQLGCEMTLVSGSAYQGGPQGFYSTEGQNGKWKQLTVPLEFAGFVQSGCCAEV
ncbi:F-box/kelch-repeat protein At1g15670 [Linum perenne]